MSSVELVCVNCGVVFVRPYKKRNQKNCSKACATQRTWNTKTVYQEAAKATAPARGDKLRYSGEGRSYVKLNGRHMHRVIAEQKIGRPLRRGEIVHHIDGNARNNDPDNLVILTQGAHMREHGLGVPGKPLWWKPWEHRGKKVTK